jgi:hypothetical protein
MTDLIAMAFVLALVGSLALAATSGVLANMYNAANLIQAASAQTDEDDEDENEAEDADVEGEDEVDVGESPGIVELDEPYEPIVQIIKIAIAAFSLLLLGLSLSAYSKTKLKKIIYAAVAFGLFAVQLFFDYLEDAVPSFETAYNDIIFYAMTLAILVLFFIAVVRRK